MNILHPTSQPVNRAIDIAARVVLVIADIAIVLLLASFGSLADGSGQGLNILTGIILFFLIVLILGIAFSFLRPRLGSLLLLIPIIIFSIYAVALFYNVFFKY